MIDIEIKNRIDWFCKNQINDFSPTISPAPKNRDRNEIESIHEAVQYFLQNDVNEIVVQKKYMGSYCSIYLKKNLDDTYFVSRNGHKIDHINLDDAKASIAELHKHMVLKFPNFETIIIASELLPWKILGSGLIDKEFYGYYDAHKTHNNYLTHSNLYGKINQVKSSEAFVTFENDKKNLSSKEFKAKHKPHIIRQYEACSKIKILDLQQQIKSLEIYKTQIDTFGKQEKVHFKPFNILKIITVDGYEDIPNSNLTYELLNDDAFLYLKFNADNETENIHKIYDFYEKITANNEEGIMIKPEKSYVQGLVPCFKVRNNNYLTMIYGVNFHNDFDRYIYKRKISQKLEQSINGWEINQKMLQIPYKNINEENYLMKLLLLKRINDEEIEKTLDPRL